MKNTFFRLNKTAFDFADLGTVAGEQLRQPQAQCATRFRAQRKEFIEISPSPSFDRVRRFRTQQISVKRRSEVEDGLADRHAPSRPPTRRAEDAKRQVLDRKFGMAIRGGHPRSPGWIMRGVKLRH